MCSFEGRAHLFAGTALTGTRRVTCHVPSRSPLATGSRSRRPSPGRGSTSLMRRSLHEGEGQRSGEGQGDAGRRHEAPGGDVLDAARGRGELRGLTRARAHHDLGRSPGAHRGRRVGVVAWSALLSAARPAGFLPLPGAHTHGPRRIVLLHGYAMNRANFLLLAFRLRRAGLGPGASLNYPRNHQSLQTLQRDEANPTRRRPRSPHAAHRARSVASPPRHTSAPTAGPGCSRRTRCATGACA
jgi:hypothetical protein